MKTELLKYWLEEEKRVFQGWNFDSIAKWKHEEPLTWSYSSIVKEYIQPNLKILDMGTGGGEFLLTLKPYAGSTFATEGYLPNYKYSKEKLKSYGIELIYVKEDLKLDFEDDFFDVIINRHEAFDTKEVKRVLKTGGMFITQQVGGTNNSTFAKREFDITSKYSVDATFMQDEIDKLKRSGFDILESKEIFPYLRFTNVGAFVYFAKIIEWEFPGFSVKEHLNVLYKLHDEVQYNGYIELKEHRFFIQAQLL